MKNDDVIKEENEYIKDPDNIKLNYNYNSYENIINANPKIKQINPIKKKREYNISLNPNILNNKKQNELKRNSLTEISNIKNTDMNIYKKNNENALTLNEILDDKKYIQTARNNSRLSPNLFNANKIENDIKNIIKQKKSLEKKLYLNDLLSDSNENNNINIKKEKKAKKVKIMTI